MSKNILEDLKLFEKAVIDLKKNKLSDDYWKEEDKYFKYKNIEYKKLTEDIRFKNELDFIDINRE